MRFSPSTSRAAFASSAICLALLGCAGSLDHPERFAYLAAGPDAGSPGPASDGGCDPVTDIFPPSCTASACHSTQSQQANLDLESSGLPLRLVNKLAHGGARSLLRSENPRPSRVVSKVAGNPPFPLHLPHAA